MIKTPLALLVSFLLLTGILLITIVADSLHIPSIQPIPFIIMSVMLAIFSFFSIDDLES